MGHSAWYKIEIYIFKICFGISKCRSINNFGVNSVCEFKIQATKCILYPILQNSGKNFSFIVA